MSTASHMCHGGPFGSLVSSPREASPNLPASRQALTSSRSIRCKFGWLLSLPTTRHNPSVVTLPVHPFSRFFTTHNTHFHRTVHAEKPVFHAFSRFFTQNYFFPTKRLAHPRSSSCPPTVHALSWPPPPRPRSVHALSTVNARFFPKTK